MTLDVLSEGILRSKRDEITGVIQSRKRKLRELYAVARYVEYGDTIHQQFDANTEPSDQLEVTFLNVNDLFRGRFFDEATLPKNVQYSSIFDGPSTLPSSDADLRSWETLIPESRRDQRDAATLDPGGLPAPSGHVSALTGKTFLSSTPGTPRRSRRSSPGFAANGADAPSAPIDFQGQLKSPQIDSHIAAQLSSAITQSVSSGEEGSPLLRNGSVHSETLDAGRARTDGLRGSSKVECGESDVAMSAVTSLGEGASPERQQPSDKHSRISSHQSRFPTDHDRKGDERKRLSALDVRSPGPVTPDSSAKEGDIFITPVASSSADTLPTPTSSTAGINGLSSTTRGASSIPGDLPASPSSTIGESKASNTPCVNVTSADTSPENEFTPSDMDTVPSQSHLKDPQVTTSSTLTHMAEDQEHTDQSRDLTSPQLDGSELNASTMSPTDADAQLQLEDQQAAKAQLNSDFYVPGRDGSHPSEIRIDYVPDVMDEEEDEVVGVPTPEDIAGPEHSLKSASNFSKTGGIEGPRGTPLSHEEDGLVEAVAAEDIPAVGNFEGTKMDVEADAQLKAPSESRLGRLENSVSSKNDSATGAKEVLATGDSDTSSLTDEKQLVPVTRETEDVEMEDVSVTEPQNGPSTPMRTNTAVSSVPTPPERMTTRVSSGAIRHKSVSEILGEIPRPNTYPQTERSTAEKAPTDSNKVISSIVSITPAMNSNNPRISSPPSRLVERKDKDKSKRSAVTFAKHQPTKVTDSLTVVRRDQFSQPKQAGSQATEDIDYLQILHVAQASSQSLDSLLATAHKTLTTVDQYVNVHEMQDSRLLRRVAKLQQENGWSFRQPERSVEPDRRLTHWDALLEEMKWMGTDFREERKLKLVTAKRLAEACKQWCAATPEEQIRLQVNVRRRRQSLHASTANKDLRDVAMADASLSPVDSNDGDCLRSTPDFVVPADDDFTSDASDDAGPLSIFEAAAPATIFSLPAYEVVFGIQKTPSSEKLLQELPLYEPFSRLASDASADSEWRTAIVPVSKYVLGKMIVKDNSPPLKKSRYDFEEEDDQTPEHQPVDADSSYGFYRAPKRTRYELPAECNDVALFNPENKPIRDRIHAGHLFRPPSEHAMPPQSFFESRVASQWMWAEDEELRTLVKEYSYNWSLISSILSPRSEFSSGAERRTPWECFERWISLEGLPSDMQKTQYFRAYHSRIEAAQKHVMSQHLPGQQQGGANNPSALTPLRRRSTQSMRVERRKNNRFLSIIDSIRKLAKKRETSIQKLAHAAQLAAMRKQNEVPPPRQAMNTPQDFSRIKHEREVKMQERHEAYRQQLIAQQRQAQQHRLAQQQQQQQQAGQQHAISNGLPVQQPNGTPAAANAASPIVASSLPNGHTPAGVSNQARPSGPMSSLPSGMSGVPGPHNGALSQAINGGIPMAAKGVPQAPMQNGMVSQPRMPPQIPPEQHMRLVMESSRIQEQQRRYLQQQQQQLLQSQQQGRSSSPPNMGGMSCSAAQVVMQSNPNMIAAFQAATSSSNSLPGSLANGTNAPAGTSASPRMGQSLLNQNIQSQTLPNGMPPSVNNISHHLNQQLKAKYPQASAEQIQRFMNEQMYSARMTQAAMTQAAMNAAAGSSSSHGQPQTANVANGTSVSQTQMYAQMMRAQQANQIGGVGGHGVMNGTTSRSVTPQTQRSGSAQGHGQGQNRSPRPPQAQMATGQ